MSGSEGYILEVAQRYLAGTRRSGPENIQAICPFHTKEDGRPERNPSFYMSLTTGLWICHACKEKGRFRSFLRATGVAPSMIDDHYGFLLEEIDRSLAARPRPHTILSDVQPAIEERHLGLFDYVPKQMEEWGFVESTLKHFDVGFDSKHYRITFPIRDMAGRLVGISGRTVRDEDPRYKVYTDREYKAWGIPPRTTDRSLYLWHADKVYPSAYFGREVEVVVTEGFKACMWLWQCGIENTVALSGSFLSPQQHMLLERMGGPFYLFLDNDKAGHKAKWQVGSFLNRSTTVYVVEYEGHQPDNLSPEEVLEALDRAPSFTSWALKQER